MSGLVDTAPPHPSPVAEPYAEPRGPASPPAGALVGASLAGDTDRLSDLVRTALDGLAAGASDRGGPLPAGGPDRVTADVRAVLGADLLTGAGVGEAAALAEAARAFAGGSADPCDPACAAHLHCPPLAVAVAADAVAAALNQSVDSWDQGPAAAAVEAEVVTALARLVGYDDTRAGGVVTSGGTESNLMGLLFARDAAVRRRTGVDASATGLPAAPAPRLRVLCSSLAHFSVARNLALLGLGEDAVATVAVDADRVMSPAALAEVLAAVERRGEVAAAVVATAGTTDLGSIDPLPEVASVVRRHGTWLHVDAAYGGGALFSAQLAPLLRGLGEADSVALDLHKLGWQPVPAGVFLTRRREAFAPLARSVAYLNPPDDEAAGYRALLGRSLRTTRRADAFKLAVTLRALGPAGLGSLVDRCHALAAYAAERVAGHARLRLVAAPVLTTVVFAYVPKGPAPAADADAVNARLRRRLLAQGRAVVGRTDLDGATYLKLTLLNPSASPADVDAVLDAVVAAGADEEAAHAGARLLAGDHGKDLR